MTRLGAAALPSSSDSMFLIQVNEFLERSQPKEELSDFGLVAVDTAVALQELDAQKEALSTGMISLAFHTSL